MSFVVVYDACVLYPSTMRDLLIPRSTSTVRSSTAPCNGLLIHGGIHRRPSMTFSTAWSDPAWSSRRPHSEPSERTHGDPGGDLGRLRTSKECFRKRPRSTGSERDVAVCAPGGGRRSERLGDAPPGLLRFDDVVDDPDLQGSSDAAGGTGLLLDELRPHRLALVGRYGGQLLAVAD